MKTMKKIAAVGFCMLLAATVSVSSVYAQERENRDANGKIIRGPYETDKAWDHWFIGLGGGINLFEDGGVDTKVSPAINVYVGKWFTPTIGARVGYAGLKFKGETSGSDLEGNFAYIHGDAMWNFSNAVSGYRGDRFWDFIPYLSAGLLHAGGDVNKNDQFSVGGGLYNTLRLGRRVDLTLDIRQLVFKGTIYGGAGVASMTSATLGLNFNLGKTSWKRVSCNEAGLLADLEAAKAAAAKAEAENEALKKQAADQAAKDKAANDALAAENDDLKDQIKDLEDQLENCAVEDLSVFPGTVFFSIGQTTLSDHETKNLEAYIKETLDKQPNVNFTLTGYADSDTGTAELNEQLSAKRVEFVGNLLTRKFGISSSRFTTSHKVVSANGDANEAKLTRCVVVKPVE